MFIWSVYDTEVGYCQGLSFIAATLLLHMPEEEAFSVLVSIMYDYQLRELYKANFENLSLRLFQLTCMLRVRRNKLTNDALLWFTCLSFLLNRISSQICTNISWIRNWSSTCLLHNGKFLCENHMHESLPIMFLVFRFLTLFTARFPLPFVFQCIDLFLLDGIHVLFQIAFSLLSVCKKDLLIRDFESILKYIRVSLPKKFRSESQVNRLIKLASECKVKKLKKYEDEFMIQKEENEKVSKKYLTLLIF